jgi:hypothetical protein
MSNETSSLPQEEEDEEGTMQKKECSRTKKLTQSVSSIQAEHGSPEAMPFFHQQQKQEPSSPIEQKTAFHHQQQTQEPNPGSFFHQLKPFQEEFQSSQMPIQQNPSNTQQLFHQTQLHQPRSQIFQTPTHPNPVSVYHHQQQNPVSDYRQQEFLPAPIQQIQPPIIHQIGENIFRFQHMNVMYYLGPLGVTSAAMYLYVII